MSHDRFLLPLVAVAFISVPSVAQPAPTSQPLCGPSYGTGVMGFLTPEQRMMHFAEVQKAMANMSFNDMRVYRGDLRNKVMAMNGAERKKFADDLTVKWNVLPAEQHEKIQRDFTAYRGSGQWDRGMRMGRGAGRGMGRGGCWW